MRIGTTILLFTILFPKPFRDMFIVQVEPHAQHLTTELLDVLLSDTTRSTPAQAPDHRRSRLNPKKQDILDGKEEDNRAGQPR